MIYTAVLSLLSLVSPNPKRFVSYPSKLPRENKETRSGALWFSYKYIAVLKFATHKKLTNLFLERNRPDRSNEGRGALSGKFTVKFS